MIQIERYLLRTATTACVSGLVVLTGVVWVTQALRQIDLITSKGQTILLFLLITALALPSLIAFIAPVALFAGVLYTLNKLNGDSELVVMAASGMSPARLLRPMALLSAAVFAVVAVLYIQVLPWSFGAIENLTTFIHADFIANFARPGAFSQLESGFIFHFRERTPDGALHGVFMQDLRDPSKATTYIAEAGKTVDRDGASYLQLSKGVLLRPQSAGDTSMVTFDDYTIDLSQFMHAVSAIKRPRERTTAQLMAPDAKDQADPALFGHIRSELLDRLASPLYAVAGGLIAFAALGEARTTRQGRGVAIAGAVLAFAGVRMLGIAATTLAVGAPSASVFVWAIPVAACLGALALIFRRAIFALIAAVRKDAGVIGRTLSFYLAGRFARSVIAAFMVVFVLIYAVDLIELLRRSGDSKRATGILMAGLSFLRTPTVAEQALPFAVLFGSMIAFLNLSRKMELVVARAAGLSVWQFLAPPLTVIVLIGVFSVTAYNPVSTWMKEKSDDIESNVFGGPAAGQMGMWIRQKSIDGQAVVRAAGRSLGGSQFNGIEVFNFDDQGNFTERLEAASGELRQGYWVLHDVVSVMPGFEALRVSTYLLATNLDRREVAQAFVAPETVSFWRLPGLAEQTARAGLDPTAYLLKYQELLARPLMLAAMVLVAACFSLRFFRMGGIEYMVSGGVVAGFVLYVATKVVNDLGGAGFLSASVAGWSPGIVGCMFGVYVLLQQEDG